MGARIYAGLDLHYAEVLHVAGHGRESPGRHTASHSQRCAPLSAHHSAQGASMFVTDAELHQLFNLLDGTLYAMRLSAYCTRSMRRSAGISLVVPGGDFRLCACPSGCGGGSGGSVSISSQRSYDMVMMILQPITSRLHHVSWTRWSLGSRGGRCTIGFFRLADALAGDVTKGTQTISPTGIAATAATGNGHQPAPTTSKGQIRPRPLPQNTMKH